MNPDDIETADTERAPELGGVDEELDRALTEQFLKRATELLAPYGEDE